VQHAMNSTNVHAPAEEPLCSFLVPLVSAFLCSASMPAASVQENLILWCLWGAMGSEGEAKAYAYALPSRPPQRSALHVCVLRFLYYHHNPPS
jgi:hypothetical protein